MGGGDKRCRCGQEPQYASGGHYFWGGGGAGGWADGGRRVSFCEVLKRERYVDANGEIFPDGLVAPTRPQAASAGEARSELGRWAGMIEGGDCIPLYLQH